MNKVYGMNVDTSSQVTWTKQGHDDGAIFVSNFPYNDAGGVQEIHDVYFFCLPLSQESGLSERTFYHRS